MRFTRFLAAALVAGLPLLAQAQQLTVSAAASLTEAFKEIAVKFEAARPGVTLRLNFGASGVLLQQLAQGAPVDVLVSADEATVTRGVEQKLLDAMSKRAFAGNTVVVVVPAQGGPEVKALADLGLPGVRRIAVGKVATVPVGRYTREALEAVRLWTALEPRFVYADTVRQVLDYVARGEVDAGFVYLTDAVVGGDKVRVAFTAGGHSPVVYPAVVATESRHKAQAGDFIAYLLTPPAQEVLTRHGFGRVAP